jgi:hypothetical protein
MTNEIKLGYEVGTGKVVNVRLGHLIVTGITQLSGKTTTLEALIKRSAQKAIVFKTKIGERSFTQGTEIPPFFRDRSDYEFVKSLIEAYTKEKLFLEKGTLMRLTKGSSSLLDIKKRVDEEIATGKLRGLNLEIYTRLQHYLENLIPQIQYANLSKTLTVYDGINIMNLERFGEEAQSLIIQSVLDEVLKTMHDLIIVLPEAWKFSPQKYNNPCKRSLEAFIRQGAASGNYIFVDSQDMAGVDKIPLKQISTWILGYQSEKNEVKHTLDQIPLPAKQKPKPEEVMQLRKGQFYVSTYDSVAKTYVQPAWLDDKTARDIATGSLDVEQVKAPSSLAPYTLAPPRADPSASRALEVRFDDSQIRKELTELRIDFFNKVQELQDMQQKQGEHIFILESKPSPVPDVQELVAQVLQKMPTQASRAPAPLNMDAIVQEVLKRVPRSEGSAYTVAPLEKLRRDFLEEAKASVLGKVSELNEEQKKMLKYIEAQGKTMTITWIIEKCLFKDPHSGGIRTRVADELKGMASAELIGYDPKHGYSPNLKGVITKYCAQHDAKPDEIESVYSHVLMEMLGSK